MLELTETNYFILEESKYPEYRELFNDLTRDYGFSIYSYEEDSSGELEVNIHSNWEEDLMDFIEETDSEKYREMANHLIDLSKLNENINVFYYK